MAKKINSVELEKIIAEEVEKALVDEGILGGLGNVAKGMGGLAKKGYKAVKDLYKTGSEEQNAAKRARTQLEKDLVLISSFIDAAERNPQVSQAILDTELGKKLFEPEMQNEAYGANQLLQMMKAKKIDAQMVREFFIDIGRNQAAKKMLDQVKAMTPGYEPGQAQPTQQAQPTSQPTGQSVPDTSGAPVAPQGPPESPKGEDVPQPVASGEEAKQKAKDAATNRTNQFFGDVYRYAAEEVEKLADIDDATKKEMYNKILSLMGTGGKKAKALAKQLDAQINALQENKELKRLKELAGILKD